MKKFISFVFLCTLLLVCFSGCANFSDKDIVSNDNDSQSLNEGNDLQDNTKKSNEDDNSASSINNDNNANYIIVETDPSGDPMSEYAISVKIPKKHALSDTDIPVSVSYGLLNGTDVNRDSYTCIILQAENKNGHKDIKFIKY